ncbi:MAG: aromatic amino acid lyase [Gammaproteobacteria bacterium]|nr:aromatic amino acid lyase [Gammaproteobacteria bacterium]
MTAATSEERQPVDITGYDLNIDQLVAVARTNVTVAISDAVSQRMSDARQVLTDAVERGERIYGATTSVGPKTSASISQFDTAEFSRRLLRTHNVGHGPLASQEVVRGTLLVLLNSFASGRSGVRPVLAKKIVFALNSNQKIDVHLWGSMGQSDMSSMSDIALALFDDFELAVGEALALINSSAISTAMGMLAFADFSKLLRLSTLVAGLSMEGYAANPSFISDIALQSKPFLGLKKHGQALQKYLKNSSINHKGVPRNLQDPLCFRSLALIHGAADDSLCFAKQQIEQEANASQGNPVISVEHQAMAAVANFDMITLCMALDIMRLALPPVVTSSTERVAKMVDTTWSGLCIGLVEDDGIGAPGFNGIALFHKSITAEARMLSAPMAHELPSSSHSNGVMDRASLAALSARRGLEMATLCKSIFAIELIVAAQAVELRGTHPLGQGTKQLFDFVRQVIPFTSAGIAPPNVKELLRHMDENSDFLDTLLDADTDTRQS